MTAFAVSFLNLRYQVLFQFYIINHIAKELLLLKSLKNVVYVINAFNSGNRYDMTCFLYHVENKA